MTHKLKGNLFIETLKQFYFLSTQSTMSDLLLMTLINYWYPTRNMLLKTIKSSTAQK